MNALFSWLRTASTPPLVRACVAHYEILFIHPFTDGNGRMARLWQHVVMLEASPLFRFVAVESVIRERQRAYYDVLGRCDRRGDSAELIELLLEAQRDALGAVVADLARGAPHLRRASPRRRPTSAAGGSPAPTTDDSTPESRPRPRAAIYGRESTTARSSREASGG